MERRITLEGACRCPGAPHPSDWVEVIPEVSIPLGAAAIAAVRIGEGDPVAVEGMLAGAAVRFGISGWSFVDADGDPEPVTFENITRLLPYAEGGLQVADAVVAYHAEELLRPLVGRTSSVSPGGQTDGSTSPTQDTGSRPPGHSRRSSRTSTGGTPSGDPDP